MENHYELLYLVAASYSEDELEPVKQKVREAITKVEGNITFEEDFGQKKLAYPVDKNHQGYYLLAEFDLDGQNLAGLDKDLKLTNELLRHIIVKRIPGQQTNRLRLTEEAPVGTPYVKTPASDTPITSKAPEPEVKKEATKKEVKDTPKDASKEAPKEDDSKIKLEDLDDKLDELLDGDLLQ